MALRNLYFRLGRSVRIVAAALLSASVLGIAASPAEARHYRYYHSYARHGHTAHYAHVAYSPHHAHYSRYGYRVRFHAVRQTATGIPASPTFSAIVVDANSGRTLYASAEDGLRHPASITKVMTLYLLFEELDRGSITFRSQISISEHAAAQEPSKLGLQPGQTISVEDAIKAVVTRSANDVAVAIA
jgi:D-alanyl-D-alanine carboxypeptidase